MFCFGDFTDNTRETSFSSFCLVPSNVFWGISRLLGFSAIILFPYYCNAIISWDFLMFLVRQAFTSMLAKRGTVLMCGCIGYHLDGLLSQCLVALNHFDFVYCYVVYQQGCWLELNRGDVTECVPGHDLLTFLSVILSLFWLGESFIALTYEVSRLVCWACQVLFPPVSLQKQAVFELLLRHPCVCLIQRRAYTVSWLV